MNDVKVKLSLHRQQTKATVSRTNLSRFHIDKYLQVATGAKIEAYTLARLSVKHQGPDLQNILR